MITDPPNATPPIGSEVEGKQRFLPWFLLWLVLAIPMVLMVSEDRSWGWDESMHVGLPATHMAQAASTGDLGEAAQVALNCNQYPFVYPAVVASAELLFGAADNPELFGRRVGRFVWSLGLLGLLLLALELSVGLAESTRKLAAFFTICLGLFSPLFMDYSGTWFLEVPFATVSIFCVALWLRRTRLMGCAGGARRDFAVGALIALAFFTKFNYGLLLGAGLFLDVCLGAIFAIRERSIALFGISSLRIAVVPAVAFTWWFVFPLPGGSAIAEIHRTAFMDFLAGNQQLDRMSDARRLLDLGIGLFPTPRVLLAVVIGLVLSLALLVRAPRRVGSLWIVLLTMGVPIALHNFHLDRFLLGPAPFAFALGALGIAHGLGPVLRGHAALIGAPVLIVLALVMPTADGNLLFAKTIGFATSADGANPEQIEAIAKVRAYQEAMIVERQAIGPGRPLSTNGIASEEAAQLLDLMATEVLAMAATHGPAAKFGWLGINTELSPAALHIGVVARGGDPARLRRDAGIVRGDGNPDLCVTFQGVDPGWNDDQLRAWSAGFEVIFMTTPPALKPRSNRAFVRGYQERLVAMGDFTPVELGKVQVSQLLKDPLAVSLYALRRNR
ncbi:MAG: hypothetical protein ACJAZ8_002092 [Planctomycetota bacterium]|jgi:hypothetical protein